MAKLDAVNFGLALGTVCAIYMFLLGLSAGFLDWGNEWVTFISSVYVGYGATVVGSLIGAVWGFIDGFIGGYVFAWIYNRLST